ncbi:MAG: hypothetical protein HRT67_06530 [Flavobacteriaceae bacterium]|nr:hypothetical protein [Flavobacteriaceae bacterium]
MKKKFIISNLLKLILILIGSLVLLGIFIFIVQYFFGQKVLAIVLVSIALITADVDYFKKKKNEK